jgi:excisionase family DNA binding protein
LLVCRYLLQQRGREFILRKPSVVASVVATGLRFRPDPAGSVPRRRPLPDEDAARCGVRQEVDAVTQSARLAQVQPTSTDVIRSIRERLDALERDLLAARSVLAEAETALLASHVRSAAQPMALTTDQVAQLLGLSRSTVTAMIGRSELPSVKVGGSRRVLRRDLDSYLASIAAGGAA